MPEMKVFNVTHSFSTRGEGEFVDLTDTVQKAIEKSGVKSGFVHVFAPHATGVLLLTENEPALLEDIRLFIDKATKKRQLQTSFERACTLKVDSVSP